MSERYFELQNLDFDKVYGSLLVGDSAVNLTRAEAINLSSALLQWATQQPQGEE